MCSVDDEDQYMTGVVAKPAPFKSAPGSRLQSIHLSMSSLTDCTTCGAWAPAQCTCEPSSLPPQLAPCPSTSGSNWSFPSGSSHFLSAPMLGPGYTSPANTPGPLSAPSVPPPATYQHDSSSHNHPSYPLHGPPGGLAYMYVTCLSRLCSFSAHM